MSSNCPARKLHIFHIPHKLQGGIVLSIWQTDKNIFYNMDSNQIFSKIAKSNAMQTGISVAFHIFREFF